MEQSVPVRVVRGHKCQSSYVKKVYTYDGLYMVTTFKAKNEYFINYAGLYIKRVLIPFILQVDRYWAEKGVSGFTVYKFQLKRCEGQPPLKTKEVLPTFANSIYMSIKYFNTTT